MELARKEAITNLNKDISFRRWATEHGGVYVPVSEQQKPVPWLSHIPEQTVVTPSGRLLTLLNPASMLRQVMDHYASDYGIRGRITGLKVLNPANAPDEWETRQIKAFEQRQLQEIWEEVPIDGIPHLRYLRAMKMEPGCEKCHAILGFKAGDIRGATGVNVPLTHYHAQRDVIFRTLSLTHLLFWLAGILGIGLSLRVATRYEAQRKRDWSALEERVQQRTLELELSRNQAQEANQAKNEFLSRMSHELRTPLNAILGFSQLMENSLSGQKLDAQQRDNLQEIRLAGQHLLDQVNELLDLSRIESGRIEIEPEPVALHECLRSALKMVEPLATKNSISVVCTPFQDIHVQADPLRLRQILINLLSNAIKYNRPDGWIKVSVCPARTVEDQFEISVTDSGKGIAPENLPRLFQLFERVGSAYDGIEGTGIGLALVKRLVEAMSGQIGVESVINEGSRFWFTLPQAWPKNKAIEAPSPHVSNATPPAELPASDEAAPDSGVKKHRILYIEDNPANLKLVRKLLATQGNFHLLEATNGHSGLKLAQEMSPNLILLDIHLPDMNGFEILKGLKQDAGTQHIPVVALSANAMAQDQERALQAGFSAYLTKPLDVTSFVMTITDFLSD